jgi:hypothetical protein
VGELGVSAGDLGVRAAVEQLDAYMKKKGISEETRNAITNSISMMYEYIPYALNQGKDPSDGKVLREFLVTKGGHALKYFENGDVNCAVALVEFLNSVRTALSSSRTGNVPLATLTWGLAALDLLEVGNSCEAAQRAYYETFLKEKNVTIKMVESSSRPGRSTSLK